MEITPWNLTCLFYNKNSKHVFWNFSNWTPEGGRGDREIFQQALSVLESLRKTQLRLMVPKLNGYSIIV